MKTHYKQVNNIKIPSIGLGTYKLKGEECFTAVKDALDIGYRHIDTAQMYENEDAVGQALSESKVSREDIWLTTKIWHTNLAPAKLIATFEESLQKLQTPYVDLLLIHWPSTTGEPLQATLGAMRQLQDLGKVKHIGVSNFPVDLYKKAINMTHIICNQVEYHPFLLQKDLWLESVNNNMFLTAYSPIGQGKAFESDLLKKIGYKYGKNAGQVALRWLIQQDNVLAIPRSSSSDHRKDNFSVFDFQLSEEEMISIFKLATANERMVDPEFAPEW